MICNNYDKNSKKMVCSNCDENNKKILYGNEKIGWTWIYYCPFCGRKLK